VRETNNYELLLVPKARAKIITKKKEVKEGRQRGERERAKKNKF